MKASTTKGTKKESTKKFEISVFILRAPNLKRAIFMINREHEHAWKLDLKNYALTDERPSQESTKKNWDFFDYFKSAKS